MSETKRIIVYHNTQQAASRWYKPRPGETVGYAAIADWNPEENAKFDSVMLPPELQEAVNGLKAAAKKRPE